MIWGLSTSTFTIVHVVLSLVGIFTGLVAMFGLVAGRRLDGWTVIFLATTVATSVTGFGFPFDHLLPSHKVGIVSLLCSRWRLRPATRFTSRADGAAST
jgi:hypothetical protein